MEKIIVYGAGKIGRLIYNLFKGQNKEDCIMAFCDKNFSDIDAGYFGRIPVLSFEELKNVEVPFVIGVGMKLCSEVEDMLLAYGKKYYRSIQMWIEENIDDEKCKRDWLKNWVAYHNGMDVYKGWEIVREHDGICPICGHKTIFICYDGKDIRNKFNCAFCYSSPRHRAFWKFFQEEVPNWRNLKIHECAPGGLTSQYLQEECPNYSMSFFYEDKPFGEKLGGKVTNQNLENLTFPDEFFDVVITLDVLEHVNEPDKVFNEIARVLKKGGKHIFMVPMLHGMLTYPRIKMQDGKRVLIDEPIYHGNPISKEGSLLTYEYGDNLPQLADANPYGTSTRIIQFPRNHDDVISGLDGGDDIRVIVTEKSLNGLQKCGSHETGVSCVSDKMSLPKLVENTDEGTSKPYHIGYVAGVFDLFHIGHLNILRRAKEHCDYLIVGVVSDRQVREYKKVEPFVPFEERLDMIRSCRYVDEAHEIPFEHPDTDMAWKLYRFDVQFSGSDYEHDPVWLKKKKWLEERGSTMVFFPYTQSTSSTRLKKLIEERLI